MAWWNATSVTISNNQNVVVVNAADNIGLINDGDALVLAGQIVEIDRAYFDNNNAPRILLKSNWTSGNQTNQPAKAVPIPADLRRAVQYLRDVGQDAITFSEAMAQILSSTAATLVIPTATSGDVTVVPYGRLVQQVNDLLATMGTFGVPLYGTNSKNQARTLMGLQPQVTAQPTLDLDFANNEYRVYEPFGLTRKTLTEAITTARASSANYNSPFGVASAAANVPRIEYDPATGECLGLLCEEQRTNLIAHSVYTAANNATPPTGWSLHIGTGTTTTEASQRVSGATRSRQSGTNQRAFYQQNVAVAANTTYTLSAFFAAGTSATNQVLGIGSTPAGTTGTTFLNGSAVVPNAVNSITFTTGAEAGTIQVRVGLGCFADATGIVIHETPQLEVGSFHTSYIATQGSQVTRAADSVIRNLANITKEATLICEFISPPMNSATAGSRLISVNDGTTQNRFTLTKISNSNSMGVFAQISGSSVAGLTSSMFGTVNPKTKNKFGLSFKTGELAKAVLNGGTIAKSSAPCIFTTNYTNLDIGKETNTAYANTAILNVILIPRYLTDQELIDLTRL